MIWTALLLPSTTRAQDKKLDSFTISYASVSGTRAPLWIAKDLNLFEKYGLDGNLIYIASGVTSVNALLGGSVDIIAASGSERRRRGGARCAVGGCRELGSYLLQAHRACRRSRPCKD